MAPPSSPARRQSGHLAYYRAQGISPVRYRMQSLAEHFERREALYRAVGLPQVAFKGARVLEVAPGSGQNSLYVAQAKPRVYHLVEPNPAAVSDIRTLYREYREEVEEPDLFEEEFERFEPDTLYDIVLCENWLGSLPSERALIRKLSSLVDTGGAMVLTIVPPSGFAPNVLRRLFALRLMDPGGDFAARTSELSDVFASHLATIPGMTRSVEHWVQDCVLNPHYLNVVLSLDTVLEDIGDGMEALGSSPRFATDWRWFKAQLGDGRDFNGVLLRAYYENLHNFVDYRRVYPPREADENRELGRHCEALQQAALAFQTAMAGKDIAEPSTRVLQATLGIAAELAKVDPALGQAFREAGALFKQERVTAQAVRGLSTFGPLFGRETIYVAFTRKGF